MGRQTNFITGFISRLFGEKFPSLPEIKFTEIWNILLPQEKLRIIRLVLSSIFINAVDLLSAYAISLLAIIIFQYDTLSREGLQAIDVVERIKLRLEFSDEQAVTYLTFFCIALIILKITWSILINRIILVTLGKISSEISRRYFEKLFCMPYSWVKSQRNTDIAYTLNQGSQFLIIGMLGQAIMLVSDLLILTTFIVALLWINLSFTFYGLFVTLLATHLYTRRIKAAINNASHNLVVSTISGEESTLDIMKMWREIRIQNRQIFAIRKFSHFRENAAKAFATGNWLQTFPKATFELFGLIILVVLVAPVIGLTNWQFSPATLIITFALVSRILPIGMRIQQASLTMQSYSQSASKFLKLKKVIDARAINSTDETEESAKSEIGYCIEINDLQFRYPEANQAFLTLPSISIPEGSFVGIVGNSGSGKSTFCDLLLGFLAPNNGSIKIGGLDSTEIYRFSSLGISFISQNTKIIHGSIAENVRFGLSPNDASDIFISNLLRDLGLGFIDTLPEGLNTKLNAESAVLSGGELQRIGIARALVSKPKIIVMDEAINALDDQTAKSILDYLNLKEENRTVILVTHEAKYLAGSDLILSFEAGEGRILKN